mgnify:FL=1
MTTNAPRSAATSGRNSDKRIGQELTVPADPRYPMARGTVTVIAYKEGYRDLVMPETPVSEGSAAQPLHLVPVVPDERNEPIVQLGNNHRLEIISMVDKYKPEAQGPSSTCSEPPRSIEWGGKTYALKEIGGEELEPGMKLGYLECADGKYIQHNEGENATCNVYSFGSPPDRDDLLYFGAWGRALYTPAEPDVFKQ